jgi:hypothetical protein
MARTTWLEGRYAIIEGESMALHEALKAMQDRGLSQVLFESNSKSLLDALLHFCGGNS